MQLPPPVHGASMVNSMIKNSALLNRYFDTFYINIAPSDDIKEIGKFSLIKVLSFIKIALLAIFWRIKFRPDLVYLTLSPYGIAFVKDAILAMLMKASGAKVIYHMHGKGIAQEVENHYFKKLVYRTVFKSADIIHLSESLIVDIEPVIDKSKEVYVLNNGIEDLYKPGGIRNEKFTFVYLSNIGPSKGANLLVEASKILLEQGVSDFKVEIYGNSNNSSYYNTIEENVKSIRENNVQLCGPVYGQDKYDCLSRGHVFVLPTKYRNECFPLAILEAMSCGLPIISTKEGAIPDIVDDSIGFVLDNLSADSLATAMKNMLNDQEFYLSATESARNKYKNSYTINVFERNLANIFRRFLS